MRESREASLLSQGLLWFDTMLELPHLRARKRHSGRCMNGSCVHSYLSWKAEFISQLTNKLSVDVVLD